MDRAAPPRRDPTSAAPPEGSDPAAQGAGEYDVTRSVFLGNVGFGAEDEDIIALFTSAEALKEAPELRDQLEAVRLVRDSDTKIGKGFGFALFKTKTAARAVSRCMGKRLAVLAVVIRRCFALVGLCQ